MEVINTIISNARLKKLGSESKEMTDSRQWRIANIERLRILAAFGIVWFHTEDALWRSVGYAGLPIFLMVFCSLIALKQKPDDISYFTMKRAGRLLKPWLFWSIVYLCFKIFKRALYGEDVFGFFTGHMFISGTSIHLWYLPYAFLVALFINFWNNDLKEHENKDKRQYQGDNNRFKLI